MSCEYFTVTIERPGLVTVEARSIDGGTIVPRVGWENPGPSSTFSQRVQTAGRLWINVAIPRGATPRYEIRTSFAP